jgi:PEP-CTERM motif
MRIASLSLLALCLTLAAVPAMAQTVYSNGAINGNTDAWTINFGFVVSDTFNVSNNNTTITGGSFGMWLFSGDTLTSAELSITSGEDSGTSYFDQTVNFTQGACTANQYGYNVCQENTSFNGPTLNAGSYWLNLQNASVPSGDPVYWDENSGPSMASENSVGSIPSESFTVIGGETTSTTTSTTTSVPEPCSIMLLGSGILGLAGVLRRKLF